MPPIAGTEGSSTQLAFNPAAGGAVAIRDGLARAARKHGILVRVLERGQDARQAALAAAEEGARTLAVAGGDGSVAAVAGVAMEHDLPLVIVPVGTLNHFAHDLGLDLTRPLDALDAVVSTHERMVDVGRINGRPFINNVSLGVYAQMLADPGYRQGKLGVAQAKLQAAISDPKLRRMLRITPPGEVPLESHGGRTARGPNPTALAESDPGGRESGCARDSEARRTRTVRLVRLEGIPRTSWHRWVRSSFSAIDHVLLLDRRRDILVEPEEVGGIIATLDLGEPIPGRLRVGLAYPLLALFAQEAHVRTTVALTQSRREITYPRLARSPLLFTLIERG